MTNLFPINTFVRCARACVTRGLVLGLWLIVRVHAQDLNYTTTNGTITITFPNAQSGVLSVPDTINGLPVVNIAATAFITNGLISVTIPSSVTNIGAAAFSQCPLLTNVTIADGGFMTIENDAFAECHHLTNITFPNTLTSVGDRAFSGCQGLTHVTFGSAITNVGSAAFEECYYLTSIYFKGNAPDFGSEIGYLDTNLTVYYLPGTTGWGATAGGAPARLWNPQMQTSDASFGVRRDAFGFQIVGTADIPLAIEASTGLAAQSWVRLQIFTLTNGQIYFSDSQWTNYPSRFYRIRSP
jgi:hypothetical protein